jgi:elongation factor G
MSFELCAKQGFREAARKAKPVLLEPIMRVEVITPDQYMGDVTGDLNRRRGMLEGMDSKANAQVIKCKVPLSEMFGYVTQLRSLSSGRATSTMEFSHYAPAPNNVAEEVIAKVKGGKGKVNANQIKSIEPPHWGLFLPSPNRRLNAVSLQINFIFLEKTIAFIEPCFPNRG